MDAELAVDPPAVARTHGGEVIVLYAVPVGMRHACAAGFGFAGRSCRDAASSGHSGRTVPAGVWRPPVELAPPPAAPGTSPREAGFLERRGRGFSQGFGGRP